MCRPNWSAANPTRSTLFVVVSRERDIEEGVGRVRGQADIAVDFYFPEPLVFLLRGLAVDRFFGSLKDGKKHFQNLNFSKNPSGKKK